jgi:hypothetical protein
MTAETALGLLHGGDPAGALASLGDTISPDEIDLPPLHAAWSSSPITTLTRR